MGHFSPMNWLRKQPSGLVGPPFLTDIFFWAAQAVIGQAVTIENSIMSGCGLSHESAEKCCKGSFQNPRERE